MLLVLDNFEHVMAAAPQLSLVLSECAYVRVLVTSRVSLKLAGELEVARAAGAVMATGSDQGVSGRRAAESGPRFA
jgi:hypothetical protein